MCSKTCMKELVNLNKLQRDLIDSLKQRAIRVSSAMPEKHSKPIYFRAIGTKELEKTVNDVFANLEIIAVENEKGPEADIADAYAAELRRLADEIETVRCKIWRTSQEKEMDKETLNNNLFSIQSNLRHAADEVSWSYFGD